MNDVSRSSSFNRARHFQFDPESLQLRSAGYPYRLECLPARVLAHLLDRQDQLVTRLELVQLLWPEETHGDFSHRLDKVIHKLRVALHDDYSAPIFIQTLRGNGFRFIGGNAIVRPERGVAIRHEQIFQPRAGRRARPKGDPRLGSEASYGPGQ